MSVPRLVGGLLAIILTGLIVASYLVWDDGRQFVAAETVRPAEPTETAAPGYLDSEQLEWKSPEAWQQYMRAERAKALADLAEEQ